MEIEYIKEFVMLVNHESYVAAAEKLYICQSSLSKHIMALEKELGQQLFNRTTRKVRITPFGALFLPYAMRIVETNNEFLNEAAHTADASSGAIRFGVLPAFISYRAAAAVRKFREQCPDYPVSLVEGSNSMLQQKLEDGSCNVILVRTYEEPLSDSVISIPLLRDHLILVVPTASRFDTGKKTITMEELQAMELITSASAIQAKILQNRKDGIRLNIVAQLSHTNSVMDMLRQGAADGAILNRYASVQLHNDDSLRLIDIDPPITTLVSLAYNKNTPMTPGFRTFIDTVADYVARGEFKRG